MSSSLARRAGPTLAPRKEWRVAVWMQISDQDVFSALMKSNGFSNTSLGRAAGCSRQMVAFLRNAKRSCTPTLAEKLAEALGVPAKVVFARSSSRIEVQSTPTTRRKEAA